MLCWKIFNEKNINLQKYKSEDLYISTLGGKLPTWMLLHAHFLQFPGMSSYEENANVRQ